MGGRHLAKGQVNELVVGYLSWFDSTQTKMLGAAESQKQRQYVNALFDRLEKRSAATDERMWKPLRDKFLDEFLSRNPAPYALTERDQILQHVAMPLNRLRDWMELLPKTKSADNGFVASLMALRALLEGTGEDITLDKQEVDSWEAAYESWFTKTKKRFPKKIDPEESRSYAIGELKRLKKFARPQPSLELEAVAARVKAITALAIKIELEQRDAEKAKAEQEKCGQKSGDDSKNEYDPCRLVETPGKGRAKPSYSL
ncbi:MAG: hypothetical protein ACF8CQ_01085, partial [Rhodopirellula sp. JB044]|uniref:hypothetical protein n=1 Tax=Rhodopirellula sp. JB044 TaxID=3342844 RepID=UPI00370AD242